MIQEKLIFFSDHLMTFLKDEFNQPTKKIILFLRLFCSLT